MVNERTRLQEIDAIASAFTDEDVQGAKYGSAPCTAQELAHRVAKNAAKHNPPPKVDVPMTEEEKFEAGRAYVHALLHK